MTFLKLAVIVIALTIFGLRLRDLIKLSRTIDNEKTRQSKKLVATAAILFAITVTLDITPAYDTIDALLGSQGFANLIMRACVYVLFLLLGIVTARAFNSMLALWLIKGRPGQIVLGTAITATVVSHVFGAYATLNPYETPAGWIYSLVWQLYLAYIGICLLTALLPAIATPGGALLRRYCAAITATGYLFVIVYPFVRSARELFNYQEWYTDALKMGTVLFILTGTSIPWIVGKIEQRKKPQPAG